MDVSLATRRLSSSGFSAGSGLGSTRKLRREGGTMRPKIFLSRPVICLSVHRRGRYLTVIAAVLALTTGCFSAFLKVKHRALDEKSHVFLGGGGNSFVLLHGSEALIADVK